MSLLTAECSLRTLSPVRRGWFQMVFALSISSAVGACGGKVAEVVVDEGILLIELSRNEKMSLCEELDTPHNIRALTCRRYGISGVEQRLPASDELARSVCEEAYQDCMDEDPCAWLPVFVESCEMNVAQYRQCHAEHLEFQVEAYQDLPLCSDVTKDTPSEDFHVTAVYPKICWVYLSCLDDYESGAD